MKQEPLGKKYYRLLTHYGLDYLALENCTYSQYQPGDSIFTEGLVNNSIFIVTSGKAKVFSSASNGKALVLSYYNSHGLMGDMEMMSESKTATSTVVALTNFDCITIPYYKNEEKLKQNITFMNLLAKSLSEKLINSSNDFVLTTLYTCEQRLSAYIQKHAFNEIFKDNLTNVAARTGMSYRHLQRLLKQFCRDNILQKQDGGYLILNPEKLYLKSSCIK